MRAKTEQYCVQEITKLAYVAQIKPKDQPTQRINNEFYYSLVPDTYIVDWSYRSWQKNEIEYTDIKELIKAIAVKCR